MSLMKILFAATALAGAAAGAQAASLHVLTGDGKLVTVDTETRKAGRPMPITGSGTGPGGRVLSIALRPADGKLYGLTAAQQLVTIDPASGRATPGARLDKAIDAGPRATINFNPLVDRLRVIGSGGANYRIHPDTGAVTADGALKYAPGSASAGSVPRVTAAAYTNHVVGTKETALYTIDALLGQINLQAPPNDGVQQPKKQLAGGVPNGIGFDILADGTGYLLAGGTLWRVTVSDLALTEMGPVSGLATAEIAGLAAAM